MLCRKRGELLQEAKDIDASSPSLSIDDPRERMCQSLVFSDHAARYKPRILRRLVRSEPYEHAPIWIANYQIDRN